MGSNYDTLPLFDSPDVPAEVVFQFANAGLHAVIIATYGHKAKLREVNSVRDIEVRTNEDPIPSRDRKKP
jgi:hypothetical protein